MTRDEHGRAPIPSALDISQFKDVMGRFATGVSVVTAIEDDVPVGFTCQTFVSLSIDPPLVALAPAKSSTSWPRIALAGAFCVNVLASDQVAVGRKFARSGGDKFDGVSWRRGATGAPVIEDVLAWVDCELELVHDAGDHELVVGRVIGLGASEGAPLIFYRSSFASICPLTGSE
ncbi:MAG: flavin reductase domain protein FMN-binding protein [Acidimicrobiaceae bacterium]|nr:flavin reductase domain protein FMN-binding protein [Acidimicrobiaceae bacterium]